MRTSESHSHHLPPPPRFLKLLGDGFLGQNLRPRTSHVISQPGPSAPTPGTFSWAVSPPPLATRRHGAQPRPAAVVGGVSMRHWAWCFKHPQCLGEQRVIQTDCSLHVPAQFHTLEQP